MCLTRVADDFQGSHEQSRAGQSNAYSVRHFNSILEFFHLIADRSLYYLGDDYVMTATFVSLKLYWPGVQQLGHLTNWRPLNR